MKHRATIAIVLGVVLLALLAVAAGAELQTGGLPALEDKVEALQDAVAGLNAALAALQNQTQNTIAFAHVRALDNNGVQALDTANSSHVLAYHQDITGYCFSLSFTPKNAVATMQFRLGVTSEQIYVSIPPDPSVNCGGIPNPTASVIVFNSVTLANEKGPGFYVLWTE